MATKRKMIHVYVTEDEKQLIEERAEKRSLSVSRHLLYLALNEARKPNQDDASEKVLVTKPDRSIPSPPEDGVQRGFILHPSKKEKA